MFPNKTVQCDWEDDTKIKDDDWEIDFFLKYVSRPYYIRAHVVRLTDQRVMDLWKNESIHHTRLIWRDFVNKNLMQHTLRVCLDTAFQSDHNAPSTATHSRMTSLPSLVLENSIIQTVVEPDFQLVIDNPNAWCIADTQCRLEIAGLRFRTFKVEAGTYDIDDFVDSPEVQYARFLEASEAWRDVGN